MDKVDVDFEAEKNVLLMTLRSDDQKNLKIRNIDARFIIPLLPYPHSESLDAFDKANLMLAEYARNGIQLSYQNENSLFGYFYADENLFSSSEEEYEYRNGMLQPKSDLRPVRFSVTNNCLKPGLWELNATDSVGEMYHGWFDFPKKIYYQMIRSINGLKLSDKSLSRALRYQKDLSKVPLKLDKLRHFDKLLLSVKPNIVSNKPIAAYSTQDSRRKVQKGYFKIFRNMKEIEMHSVSGLKDGDIFRVKRFVPPGVYSDSKCEKIPFNRKWNMAVINGVTPRTKYHEATGSPDGKSYVEITIFKDDGNSAVVMGNIPVDLLVAQEDYGIFAFGVGVFPPMEPIERRYLRYHQGPVPHYAYEIQKKSDQWVLKNNHESGIEQIFLRPFERDRQWYLRVNLVSYERIVDLIELEVPLKGPLKEKIVQATASYIPPLFRVYEDKNIL